jgi:hypothetical protein
MSGSGQSKNPARDSNIEVHGESAGGKKRPNVQTYNSVQTNEGWARFNGWLVFELEVCQKRPDVFREAARSN